jgi:hypothetical protein
VAVTMNTCQQPESGLGLRSPQAGWNQENVWGIGILLVQIAHLLGLPYNSKMLFNHDKNGK